ncbi:MAG: uroporphyrinogen-III C-methyltransferase [Phycisphaerae bacterium]
MTDGIVYLVGAGPGDPGLLTLRGRAVLASADVVVYDALLSPRLLQHAPAGAERVYVGKRSDRHTLPQEEINALLVARARAGQTVVRLKGGDPFVFGRGGEEAVALAEAGVRFEVVPGVTAGVAALAYAGIPATHRDHASALGLITGHAAADKTEDPLDWPALARWPGTLVFFMGVANLPRICASLAAAGMDAATPAAAVRWGTTSRQTTVAGTLATLPDRAAEAGLEPPAVIVVGGVVGLRERLAWFETRPLLGRRILVTRARAQASRLVEPLEALGAEAVEAPAIRIEPPEDRGPLFAAARDAGSFDWIVFTSVNGVDAFFEALAETGGDARALAGVRLATIGPATTERLAGRGLRADLQPATYTGAAVAEALASAADLGGAAVLLPRADLAPPDLADALAAAGARVTEVAAYRTVPDAAGAEAADDDLRERRADWITFTSSSTVRNLVEAAGADVVRASGAHLASIGPTTSAALREAGLAPTVEAAEHTIPGLVAAILEYERAV